MAEKKKWNKEGVTPLMVTMLLLSLAVAVGVVIMNFGRAQVEEKAQCAIDIGLHFVSIGGEEQFCYDAGKKALSFTVENGLNIKVEGLIVNVIGTEKAETLELNEAKMTKAGTYVGKASFDSAAGGQIRQVKITPKVVLYDAEQICSEQALVVESVKRC